MTEWGLETRGCPDKKEPAGGPVLCGRWNADLVVAFPDQLHLFVKQCGIR